MDSVNVTWRCFCFLCVIKTFRFQHFFSDCNVYQWTQPRHPHIPVLMYLVQSFHFLGFVLTKVCYFAALRLKYFMTLYLFPSVCTWPDTPGSIHHASWDRPKLVYLCRVARGRLLCCEHFHVRGNSANSAAITTRCRRKKGGVLRYNATNKCTENWIGDLATICFPFIVQQERAVEWRQLLPWCRLIGCSAPR